MNQRALLLPSGTLLNDGLILPPHSPQATHKGSTKVRGRLSVVHLRLKVEVDPKMTF